MNLVICLMLMKRLHQSHNSISLFIASYNNISITHGDLDEYGVYIMLWGLYRVRLLIYQNQYSNTINGWFTFRFQVKAMENIPVSDTDTTHDIKINNFREYISSFFESLELSSDLESQHDYKAFIRGSIDDFINNGTKDSAFEVYQTFLDSYQIVNEETHNPFADLLDTLRKYEENASVLTDKQRDHYVHSVNVFLLGLAIYAKNPHYQDIFIQNCCSDSALSCLFTTKNEEFFYRWGIASLFHDVGYPAEISVNQVGKFFNLITSVDTDNQLKVQLSVDDFKRLNCIAQLPNTDYSESYSARYQLEDKLDLFKPTDILAHKLHLAFNLDLYEIKEALDSYMADCAKLGFVDHGFYSSLIVLKWYGHLLQIAGKNPEIFYYQIADCASAILLHNYYKNFLRENKRFNHGPMKVEEHPLAWMLILCDELQEWNREAYGILDKQRILAADASLFISNTRLSVTYIAAQGKMKEDFAVEKENDLQSLLQFDRIFSQGISIDCETMNTLGMLALPIKEEAEVLPRPLMANLEKLAIGIHNQYNHAQLQRNPDKELEYPRFSDLPESLKYSNLRQARDIVKKLKLIDCEIRSIDCHMEPVTSFSSDEIEFLAKYEHDLWMEERINSGWTFGEVKDVEKKKSPYLIPYEDLSEEIKQLDRDTINNIPILLKSIGMAVCRLVK